MSLPDILPIRPFRHKLNSQVRLPGSKSITNRALLLAALSRESLTLEGALFSDDTRIMIACLQELGFTVRPDEGGASVFIVGQAGKIPRSKASLFVGNAGTAARFLTAFLALHPEGEYHLDGTEAMRKRPMQGLLDALTNSGAVEVRYHGEAGHFPFTLKTRGLAGGELRVNATSSSQLLSALLMIAPCAQSPLSLHLDGTTVSLPFVSMTLAMMEQFGQIPQATSDTGPFTFKGQSAYYYRKPAYLIEPDATAASYFFMLPWITGGSLRVKDTYGISLQGDIRFIEELDPLGAFFSVEGRDLVATYKPGKKSGIKADFNAISDTFLTLAAVTPLLDGPTEIRGIAHTRKQETDRIHAMATELKRLGQRIIQTEDTLKVEPDYEALQRVSRNAPVAVDTYEDHRVAMSFAILGSHDLHGDGRPWLAIRNPACCAKTFPHFFETLESLREV